MSAIYNLDYPLMGIISQKDEYGTMFVEFKRVRVRVRLGFSGQLSKREAMRRGVHALR